MTTVRTKIVEAMTRGELDWHWQIMGKYIFITGRVVSSPGKGVTAALLGLLFRLRGLKASFLKFDPYLNRNAGAMNPHQHGEAFVAGDGAETDPDLGHYERFAGVSLGKRNNVTAGQTA